MKGFIFGVAQDGDIEAIVRKGLFGTRQRAEITSWQMRDVYLETVADYLTIAPGDKIFFFSEEDDIWRG